MYKILRKVNLNESVVLMEIKAEYVARNCQPGQFVMVGIEDNGERIPLTIQDYDRERKTINIIFQAMGFSTMKLKELEVGDKLSLLLGPLGKPSHFSESVKSVLGIGGGVGIAPLFPQMRYLSESGVNVDVILGGRNADLVILRDQFEPIVDNLFIATDDGSLGQKGFVTDVLQQQIDAGRKYDLVVAVGPLVMMRAVINVTKKYNIPTNVSLNPIMIDGTGMCGGCRVTIGGETKFACVDGPDFDGHKVDFDEVLRRQSFYKNEEDDHACRIGMK